MAFKRAVREQTPLLIGLAGQSGSGKTMSALEIATGLGGKIAAIDTERGRMLHYAENYTFDHDMLTPPFTPERYIEAIVAAEKHVGPGGAVIVDSMSHEHEGVGGLLEMAGEIAQKMAARSGGNPEAYTFPSWREPKQRHQRMVNRMLQLSCHLICCFRAKEKMKLVEVEERGRMRNKPVSQGIQPIMEENFPFEMTFLAILHPDQPGVPHWTHKALMEGLRPLFRPEQKLDRQLGRRLGEWAKGGVPRQEMKQEHNGNPETGEVHDDEGRVVDAPAPPNGRRKTLPLYYKGRKVDEHPDGSSWRAALLNYWKTDRVGVAEPANLALLRRMLAKAPEDMEDREVWERLVLDMAEDLNADGEPAGLYDSFARLRSALTAPPAEEPREPAGEGG